MRVAILVDAAWSTQDLFKQFVATLDTPDIDIVGICPIGGMAPRTIGYRLFDIFDRMEHAMGRGMAARSATDAGTGVVQCLVDDMHAVSALRPDVVLSCLPQKICLPTIARYGVWAPEFGYGTSVFAPWAGAAELACGSSVALIRIVDGAGADTEELYAACIAISGTSIRRDRKFVIERLGSVLGKMLAKLASEATLTRVGTHRLSMPSDYPRAAMPTSRLFAGASWHIVRNWLRKRIDPREKASYWHLAYSFSDTHLPHVAFDSLRYLAPAKGTFWADPCPLVHEGRHYILFEELSYDSNLGRLLAIEVFEDRSAGRPQVVLERDYHLSYPHIFECDGNLYLVPETRKARRIELLRCVQFPSQWELCKVVLDNVHAVDATFWRQNGMWWMFATFAPDEQGLADELHLYYADTLLGEWTPHPANPLCVDIRCARSAGPIFAKDGKIYRPSQDCAERYGHALWINQIEQLDRMTYRERPVCRISPEWHAGVSRVHTVAQAGRLTVLDCVLGNSLGLNVQREYPA